MAFLDQLTFVSSSPKRDATPIGRFRRKLIESVDLQISVAKADLDGVRPKPTKLRWKKTEAGSKELREIPVRFRRWWWRDDFGKTYLCLRHRGTLLEIAPGKKAVEIGGADELPAKLFVLRQAICAGELDVCFPKPPTLSNAKKVKSDSARLGLPKSAEVRA